MILGPAVILAAVLALIHVSIYVLVRGRTGARLPFLLVAAFLGAWAGDALASRLDVDPVQVGDFHVLAASALAWAGIAMIAMLAVLGSDRRDRAADRAAERARDGARERSSGRSAGETSR